MRRRRTTDQKRPAIARASRFALLAVPLLGCLVASAQSLKTYGGDFLCSTLTPETLWQPAISAGVAIGWSDYVFTITGFGTGWEAYGHHYGAALADNVNVKFMRKFVFTAASGHRVLSYFGTIQALPLRHFR
jgi:hypothetical protein